MLKLSPEGEGLNPPKARQSLGPLSDDERAQIFGGTAGRFYGLNLAA